MGSIFGNLFGTRAVGNTVCISRSAIDLISCPGKFGETDMAEQDEKLPEYLKGQSYDNDDNSGPEDVVWTGSNGELDPDGLVRKRGWEHRSPLYQVIRALIAGHQPGLSAHDLEGLTRRVSEQITGDVKPGNSDDDDSPLLMEIAYRYHAALYQQGKWPYGSVPLNPIVREVVVEHGKTYRGAKMPAEDSLVQSLVRKFKKDPDLWLSRATTDDPYYSPGRMDDIRSLKKALQLLEEAGLKADLHRIKPSSRPK